MKDGWDPSQICYTAAAYLLFILGTKVFPDASGNRVSANHLQYLDLLEDVFGYSWGTVVMVHLMAEMRRSSKAVTNQFVGNFTLLQDYPFLKIKNLSEPEEHRAKRYGFKNIPKPGNNRRLTDMRLALDAMTTKEVVLNPYKEARASHKILRYNNVTFYNGPLFHPKGNVMANPRRVMRQLGYKQLPRFMTASVERYGVDYSQSFSTSSNLKVEYDPVPEPIHWRDREPRCLVDISNCELVNNGNEVDPTYIDNTWNGHIHLSSTRMTSKFHPRKTLSFQLLQRQHLQWPTLIRLLDCYGVGLAS